MTEQRDPQPRTDPDATPKVIRLRRWSWDPASDFEAELRPCRTWDGSPADDWEVYVAGKWVGTVGKYTGSIDTKIRGTRLRRQGVRRTLWHEARPGQRAMYECVSRAEAIRRLLP